MFPRRVDRGLIASLAIGQLLVLLRWILEERAEGVGLGPMALLGLAAGLWLYLIVRTVRRMARWKKELSPLTYRLGVLGMGIGLWLPDSVANAVRHSGGMEHVFSATFLWYLLFRAAIGFPIAMWAGYWFSRIMGLDAMLALVSERLRSAPPHGSGPGAQAKDRG